jgi:hypothetical protein
LTASTGLLVRLLILLIGLLLATATLLATLAALLCDISNSMDCEGTQDNPFNGRNVPLARKSAGAYVF